MPAENRHPPQSRRLLSRTARRRWLSALAALGVVAASTAVAQAQLGDVGEQGADTPHTPAAKAAPKGMFTQVGGAEWSVAGPKAEDVPAGSPTPFEADLRAVSSRDADLSVAGGSLETGGERRPVFYRYTIESDRWEEQQRFEGRGYVAKIAWIDSTRALAVGGDGAFPDREQEDGTGVCSAQGNPSLADKAGKPRAWLYTEGSGWRELAQRPDGVAGDELPDAMSALSAVDFFEPVPAFDENP